MQAISIPASRWQGFTLEFVFSENDYFTDHILTKEYTMRLNVHNEEPLTYEGPEIIACKGCAILTYSSYLTTALNLT